MLEARSHAPQQQNYTTNKVHIYKTIIRILYTVYCGRFPSNQEVGKTTLLLHTIVIQIQFYKLVLQQYQKKTELHLQLNNEEAY